MKGHKINEEMEIIRILRILKDSIELTRLGKRVKSGSKNLRNESNEKIFKASEGHRINKVAMDIKKKYRVGRAGQS